MDFMLSLLIFFPMVAALLGFIVREHTKTYATIIAVIEFLLSLVLWRGFDSDNPGMQFVEKVPLFPDVGINYMVGVDGISLFLVILTTFTMMVGIIAVSEKRYIKNLMITLLFLEGIIVGVFLALDAIVFYIFWELSLVPMLYIIGFWGSGRKIYAAIKFFLYTFTGSLIMLVGMLVVAYKYYVATGIWSFSILDWHTLILPYNLQWWLFIAFFIGLAVKVPMFPFHTWLPYAHGQAPTIGSVILAAVLLKMGTYGFIRLSLPMFPDASVAMIIPVAILSLIMIVYTAVVAFAQEDIKQVVAYSSISHMGVIMLGIFALNIEGISGSIFFMLSHGIISGALFMLVGAIYDRRHTKLMSEFGGLASKMPLYATIFGIVAMGSVGLPLTMGFVGEFLSLLGFYEVSPLIALIAGSSIILGAIYMLNLYRNTFFGVVTNEKNMNLKDLNKNEIFALIPLTVVIIWLGVYPKPILEPIDNSVSALVRFMHEKSITKEAKELLFIEEIVEEGK